MKGKIARRLARHLRRTDAHLAPISGAVTFTFDDAYSKACNSGAAIIEQGGGRATYYVCGGLDQSVSGDTKYHDADDLRRLQSQGHEIACHGFGHLNYQQTPTDRIQRDLELNAAYFMQTGIKPARNFAYPYGCVSARVKEICAARFRSSRGVEAAANEGKVDLSLLKSVPLYSSRIKPAELTKLLEAARGGGAWLIFFGHDVTSQPSAFDMTPELLEHAVKQAHRCGLPILSLEAALDHYGV